MSHPVSAHGDWARRTAIRIAASTLHRGAAAGTYVQVTHDIADREAGIRVPPAGVAARVWAALMVPFWTVLPGMGLIDLQTMFFEGGFYADSVGLMVSWGVFFTILVGLPFGWAAARPAQTLPVVALLALCAVTVLLGAVLGSQWEPAGVAVLLAATALPLAPTALRQGSVEGVRMRVRPAVLALAAVMTPFAYRYAADAFAAARNDPSPEPWKTNGVDHWPVQGSLAIALVLMVVMIGVWPRAIPVIRAAAALALGSLALAWGMHPDTVGSVDSPLLAGGTMLVAILVALVRDEP